MTDHLEQQLVNELKVTLDPIKELFGNWWLDFDVESSTKSDKERKKKQAPLSTMAYMRLINEDKPFNVVLFYYKPGILPITSDKEHWLIYELVKCLVPLAEKYKDSIEITLDILKSAKCKCKYCTIEGKYNDGSLRITVD